MIVSAFRSDQPPAANVSPSVPDACVGIDDGDELAVGLLVARLLRLTGGPEAGGRLHVGELGDLLGEAAGQPAEAATAVVARRDREVAEELLADLVADRLLRRRTERGHADEERQPDAERTGGERACASGCAPRCARRSSR